MLNFYNLALSVIVQNSIVCIVRLRASFELQLATLNFTQSNFLNNNLFIIMFACINQIWFLGFFYFSVFGAVR